MADLNIYSNLVNDLLLKVQKPAQYLGIEWGHLVENEAEKQRSREAEKRLKSWEEAKVRTVLIYPDLYELGMANFGTKILYQIINNHECFLCDRAYAPMKDMEDLLRSYNLPLWGWESFKPIHEFDVLGFSLSYELSYTNVLNILELSHLELFTSKRKNIFPLIFAGGPAVFNPEPMADFFDFFIIGDGEEVIIEVLNLIRELKEMQEAEKQRSREKDELLLKLAQIPGIYVPKFYEVDPNENYLPKPIRKDVPEKIKKRVVSLTNLNQPVLSPVPYLASVQDRQVLEIRRGCDRGCRFCQPGYVYLPVRERTPEDLINLSEEALNNTGYSEYSLLSLSSSDYTCLHEVTLKLNELHAPKGISLSMPSQRADRFDLAIANELNTIRKSGITLAPEAGTERLRKKINKGLKESEIKKAIENVYDSGYSRVKLYFIIGLPFEEKKDLDGIIELLRWAYNLAKVKNKKPLDITCTISIFIPKAFTPFQWTSQSTREELAEKINYLKSKVREFRLKTVKLNYTDPESALLEAVLSKGDRRACRLIYNAFKHGAKFDSWNENTNLDLWHKAAKEVNLDLNYEATAVREVGSVCPWYIIDTGLLDNFLIEEYYKAQNTSETESCTENSCHSCGVCFKLNTLNEVSVDNSNKNKFVKTIKNSSGSVHNKQESNRNTPHVPYNLLTETVQKLEIIHTKVSDLKFISHLDTQRLFEMATRRVSIPVSFTAGFNPRPKMQWLLPLPLYYESNHELMHIELGRLCNDSELQILLNEHLPSEIRIKTLKTINPAAKMPNIQNIKVVYRILTLRYDLWEKYICETKTAIEYFLKQNSQIVKVSKASQNKKLRSEKFLDIRPLVERIDILSTSPLEIKLVLLGNTRADLVLKKITEEVFNGTGAENLLDAWQSSWKIIREVVFS